jgi:hypothetical protein
MFAKWFPDPESSFVSFADADRSVAAARPTESATTFFAGNGYSTQKVMWR